MEKKRPSKKEMQKIELMDAQGIEPWTFPKRFHIMKMLRENYTTKPRALSLDPDFEVRSPSDWMLAFRDI